VKRETRALSVRVNVNADEGGWWCVSVSVNVSVKVVRYPREGEVNVSKREVVRVRVQRARGDLLEGEQAGESLIRCFPQSRRKMRTIVVVATPNATGRSTVLIFNQIWADIVFFWGEIFLNLSKTETKLNLTSPMKKLFLMF